MDDTNLLLKMLQKGDKNKVKYEDFDYSQLDEQ